MTTPADIDAIRKRADGKQWDYQRQLNYLIEQRDHNPMMANHRSQSSLNGQIGNLMQKLEPYADIAVLVDAHAQQAERVRTLEAALGTFMGASRLMITNNMLLENDGDMAVAYVMIDKNDDPIPGTPCLRAGWFRQLETAHKQAADALAANADAGNGGA